MYLRKKHHWMAKDQARQILQRQAFYILAVNFFELPWLLFLIGASINKKDLPPGDPDHKIDHYLNGTYAKITVNAYFLRGAVVPFIRLLDSDFYENIKELFKCTHLRNWWFYRRENSVRTVK